MPHKLRKIRKKRGTRTQGYGQVGQHRCSGGKGMRKAGRHKQGWTWVVRYEPDYFSKKGFCSRRKKANVVNIGKLEELAMKISAEKGLEERDGMTFLDLDKLGYNKLLGVGNITKPFSIKVASYSESATRKVEEIGGKIN